MWAWCQRLTLLINCARSPPPMARTRPLAIKIAGQENMSKSFLNCWHNYDNEHQQLEWVALMNRHTARFDGEQLAMHRHPAAAALPEADSLTLFAPEKVFRLYVANTKTQMAKPCNRKVAKVSPVTVACAAVRACSNWSFISTLRLYNFNLRKPQCRS